jgi:hypothetical protein
MVSVDVIVGGGELAELVVLALPSSSVVVVSMPVVVPVSMSVDPEVGFDTSSVEADVEGVTDVWGFSDEVMLDIADVCDELLVAGTSFVLDDAPSDSLAVLVETSVEEVVSPGATEDDEDDAEAVVSDEDAES